MDARKIDKNTYSLFESAPHQNKQKIVHFIGIGGIGMSALAQWFLTQKWAVSGSDISPNETTHSLQKLGIKIKFRHKKGNIPYGCCLVIHSQAIKPENEEIREAQKRKISVLSYPEAIGRLTKSYTTIAIAGAHGKSTTTAFVALMLIKSCFDPTVIIGTKLKEFGNPPAGRNFRNGSVRLTAGGKDSYLVLEADEYGGAFLNYSPSYTIVTNIDEEHLDFYKNLKNIKKSFLAFLARTKTGGALVLNRDSKILFSLPIETIAKKNHLSVVWYSLKDRESRDIKKIIRIAGNHNVSNALAALRLSKILNISEKTALQAIADYRGSWRRMEFRGKLEVGNWKLEVFDDYAHHPTEIQATLQAFREKFPNKKIICVFQPHQAERLKLLFKDFQSAFTDADITLILPMYHVAGRDKMHSPITSEKLVYSMQKKYPKKLIFNLSNPNNLKKAIATLFFNNAPQSKNNLHQSASHLRTSAVLVMMGAGDIVKYTDSLLSS